MIFLSFNRGSEEAKEKENDLSIQSAAVLRSRGEDQTLPGQSPASPKTGLLRELPLAGICKERSSGDGQCSQLDLAGPEFSRHSWR